MASELQAGKYLADGQSASAPSYSFGHTTATGMYSPGANQIRFSTASTDRLTLDSSGRVGVGVAPGAKLHVSSGTTNNLGDDVSEVRFIGPDKPITGEQANVVIQSNDDVAVNKGGSLAFGGRNTTSSPNASNFAQISGRKENADAANTNDQRYGGYLAFSTAGSTSDIAERMRIDSTGLATFSNGITVKGANNWSHISSQDGQSVSIADDAQIQIADVEAGAMLVHVYDRGTGYGGLIFVSYAGAPVIVADPSGVFAVADTDNKYCVYKSSDVGSHDVFLKNRSGGTKGFSVLVTAAVLDDF